MIYRVKRIFVMVLIAALVFTSFVEPLNAKPKQETLPLFYRETINDNPEVTFTATGIATEPGPIHVAAYSPDTLKTWISTSLDKASILNTWRVSPEGTLISSARDKSINLFSYPSSVTSTTATKIGSIQFPSSCYYGFINGGTVLEYSCVISRYLGNDRFLLIDRRVTSDDYYIASYLEAPVKLMSSGVEPVLTFREASDDLMVAATSAWNANTKNAWDTTWYLFRLSDVLKSIVTSKGGGTYSVLYCSSGCTSGETGAYPKFSDGVDNTYFNSRNAGTLSIPFFDSYREFNVTKGINAFYKLDNSTVPYKVENLGVTGPQVPRGASYITSNGAYQPGFPGGSDYYRVSGGLITDPYGDYLSFGTNNVTQIDRFTGRTSTTELHIEAFLPNRISNDGRYVESLTYTRPYYDGAEQYHPSEESFSYYDTVNKSLSLSPPAGISFAAQEVGPTGWGNIKIVTKHEYFSPVYTEGPPPDYEPIYGCGCMISYSTTVSGLGDMGSGRMMHNDTFEGGGKIFKDGLYYNVKGEIFSFTPESEQPPDTNEYFTFGQLINQSSQQVTNGTLSWSTKFHGLQANNMSAGISFRIQDHKNMYRLESHKNKIQLVKIVNGRKTTLDPASRPVINEQWVSYKIKITGNHFKVYENGSLVIDVSDSAFSGGTLGPYSTVDNTEFKGILFMWSADDDSYDTPGVAIVDTPVTYETTYTDPENDARLEAGTLWKFDQIGTNQAELLALPEKLISTTKFLNVNDGKGPINPPPAVVTVGGPILSFDTVGLYKVDYKVPDDPKPNNPEFRNYSKYSDAYTQYLIIHRKPFAPFTLSQSSDGTVIWNDYSYDPDRCYNHGNCQLAFAANNSVFAKKFYYITPSGNKLDSKLIRPLETGLYTVAMAVQDEHKAWSDWYVQELDVLIPAAPNHPPTVWLTFPSGSYDNPSPVSLQPTITWNQADIDPGTIFSTFNLCIRNVSNHPVECVTNQVMETTATSWAWTMEHVLSMGQKYSAQVQVSDGESWSDWSNIGWMTTNSPPIAYMTFPYGTQASPNIVNTLRPELTWHQSDPDIGYVLYWYQIQIMNEANNLMIFDSGKSWQNTTSTTGHMTVPIDLPTGQKMTVRVKVWDQYGAESEWSPQTWLMINRPPQADFDWMPKPAFEGDTVTLLNQSFDPDGDPLSYRWQIEGPAYQSIQDTTNGLIPAAVTDYHPGDYKVTLTATDPYGAADTVNKIVRVGDLTVEGFVQHTVQWELNRKAYNRMKSGEDERPRPVEVFWSGEAFVLTAKTNEEAAQVHASMSYTELQSLLTSGNLTDWTAQMYRSDFENLPDQEYTFQFRAVWPNGHVETAACTIRVINPWTDFTSSVRKE
ncbi:PKD domain-containing protein [Paenibacillus sp. 1_12]|uniref:glycoside hydrolase family 78 protein n=1 Tax=Paenibacillus sp. 1_12 TaxID=1566278 RepID=UPI000A68186F|nr:PKD domain-containing protein [Paenibacillus sp. 1_12]